MRYCIADYIVEIAETKYKTFKKEAKGFQCNNEKTPEMFLSVKDQDLNNELRISTHFDHINGRVHYSVVLRKFAEANIAKNAFLLHSACFDIDGVGVVFAAQSGTGKTTHMLNWQKLLGEKLTVVNGDKPFVRFFDKEFCEKNNLEIPEGTEFGIPYAYGTPWNGKEHLGCNMRTPLKHICFIERSETNFVTKIDKKDAVSRIMKQVYLPKDKTALLKTFELVNRLIDSCELWIIHCNQDPESAKVAYDAIFGAQ